MPADQFGVRSLELIDESQDYKADPEISVVMIDLFRHFDEVVFSKAQQVFKADMPPVMRTLSLEKHLSVEKGRIVSICARSRWEYLGIAINNPGVLTHAALVAGFLNMPLVIPPKRM